MAKRAEKPNKKKKPASVKLTREQKKFLEEFVKLDNRIAVCREYTKLWMQFFRFFSDGLEGKEITAEQEKKFFQIMNILADKHFNFVELMGDTFDAGGDVIKLLCQAGSLQNIQNMPEGTLSKFESNWHSTFLAMNRALGRLLRCKPGQHSVKELLAMMSDTKPVTSQADAGVAAK